MKTTSFWLCLSILLTLATSVRGWQPARSTDRPLAAPIEAELTDGKTLFGQIISVGQNSIEFLVDSETIPLTFEQITSLNLNPPVVANQTADISAPADQGRAVVRFVDGSELTIEQYEIVGGNAALTTLGGTTVECGVSQLSTISLLGAEANDQDRMQWKVLLEQDRSATDAIVVSKNGTLQMIEGVVGEIRQQQLTFSMETRTASVAIEKIKGVVYYRADRELPDAVCQWWLLDGSKIQVRSFTRSIQPPGFEVTTVGGVTFPVNVDTIARIDFSVGRSVFLSDLIPATNDWTPLVASPEIIHHLKPLRIARFNKDFRGRPITLKYSPQHGVDFLAKTQTFEKGVAISGGGRIVFSLNRQFKRLTGQVGFAPGTYPNGVVRLSIKTDGHTEVTEVLRANELSQPIFLDLDISKTDRISISVDYEDGSVAGDTLHLADLKVTR